MYLCFWLTYINHDQYRFAKFVCSIPIFSRSDFFVTQDNLSLFHCLVRNWNCLMRSSTLLSFPSRYCSLMFLTPRGIIVLNFMQNLYISRVNEINWSRSLYISFAGGSDRRQFSSYKTSLSQKIKLRSIAVWRRSNCFGWPASPLGSFAHEQRN